jgi:hypothetical protein
MGSKTPASTEALRTALRDPNSVFGVLPRADLAALSLESPQDRMVLSELYALLTELRTLETESDLQRLVRDDVPDLLAFSFSSLVLTRRVQWAGSHSCTRRHEPSLPQHCNLTPLFFFCRKTLHLPHCALWMAL